LNFLSQKFTNIFEKAFPCVFPYVRCCYLKSISLLKKIKRHPELITTDELGVCKQAIEELFGSEVHQRVKLGHNNSVESRYSLLNDFVRAKRGFNKFSNIPKYIIGWV